MVGTARGVAQQDYRRTGQAAPERGACDEAARRDELGRAIAAAAGDDPLLARLHGFPRPTWLELIPALQARPEPARALRRAKLVVAQRAGGGVDLATIVRDADALGDDDPAVVAALAGGGAGGPAP